MSVGRMADILLVHLDGAAHTGLRRLFGQVTFGKIRASGGWPIGRCRREQSPLVDGMGVGFQVGDLDSLVDYLRGLAGVVSVFLRVPSENEATLYVSVRDLDAEAMKFRHEIIEAVEGFLMERQSDMEEVRFSLDYVVLVDGDELAEQLEASGAEAV